MNYLTARGEMVLREERRLFHSLAQDVYNDFSNPIFVNIGVSWGATLHCLCEGAPDATLVGVDIDFTTRPVQGNPPAVLLKGDSTVLHENFVSPIHLLLIDGGHDYDTVKADILGWTPKVVSGGVVAFHDYDPTRSSIHTTPEIVGVKGAVDELTRESVDWIEIERAKSSIAFRKV